MISFTCNLVLSRLSYLVIIEFKNLYITVGMHVLYAIIELVALLMSLVICLAFSSLRVPLVFDSVVCRTIQIVVNALHLINLPKI
jgi:hypothetical protein